MSDPYISWLSEFELNNNPGSVTEEDAANQMVAAFPDLQAVQGFAYTLEGKIPYWWVVDSSGRIYSPTVHRFRIPPYLYEPL